MQIVNLSRRPFINRRPIARVAFILWILGLVLAALSLSLFARYWSGSADYRERLAELDEEIDREQEQLDAGIERLERLDLGTRNEKALEANRLIERRTFPWSKLFDDLEDVIPLDVRISSVSPSLGTDESSVRTPRRARRATPTSARARRAGNETRRSTAPAVVADEPEEIKLELPGLARNEQAMLDFVDALYEHPHFLDPFLSRETRERSGEVRFNVSVTYLVERPSLEPSSSPDPDVAAADTAEDGVEVAAEEADDAAVEIAAGTSDPALPEGTAATEPSTATRGASTADRRADRESALEAARARRASRALATTGDPGEPTDDRRRPSDRPRAEDRGGDAASTVPVQVRPTPPRQEPAATRLTPFGPRPADDESNDAPSVEQTPREAEPERPRSRQPSASASPRLFGSLPPLLEWLLPDVDPEATDREDRTA
ncbi:MAG: hypothetical protein AAGC60_28965 [Acidobacteriota bacterium]